MRTSGFGGRIPRAQGKRQGYLLLCFFFNSECSILLTPSMAFLSMGESNLPWLRLAGDTTHESDYWEEERWRLFK
jgi:hypothetical protein